MDAGSIAQLIPQRTAPTVPPPPPPRQHSGCAPAVLVGTTRCDTSGGVQGGGCAFTIESHGRRTFIRPIPGELAQPLRRVEVDGGEVTEHIELVSDDDGPPHLTSDLDPGFPDDLRDFGARYRRWQYAGDWPDSLFLAWDTAGGTHQHFSAWLGDHWSAPVADLPARVGGGSLLGGMKEGVAVAAFGPLELGMVTRTGYRTVHRDERLALRNLATHDGEMHVVASERGAATLHYLRASAEKLLLDETLPPDPKCGGGNCGAGITFVHGVPTIETEGLVLTRGPQGFKATPRLAPAKGTVVSKAAVDCGPLPHVQRKDPLRIESGYDVVAAGIQCYAQEVTGTWVIATCDDPEDRADGGAFSNMVDNTTHHHFFLFHRGD